MSGDLGAVLGPIAAGWIADWQGYAATFLVSAVISAVPVPVVVAAPETLVPNTAKPTESVIPDVS
jgi:MFS family permease